MKEKIKQLIRFITRYLGETMLIIGTGVFSYNIFNFSYKTYDKSKGRLGRIFDTPELEAIAYYYSSNALMWISVGAMLIIAGILIIKRKGK